MDKQDILTGIKQLREKSPKRKFKQAVDLLINLKDYDMKKPENKIDLFVQLPHTLDKKLKLGIFADQQLAVQAKKFFDIVITKEDFPKWENNKKDQKKLASSHDIFVSQIEVMPKIATIFGKVFGARGKMPNPKAGCVVPGTITNIEPLAIRLKNTSRLQTKNEASIKVSLGTEDTSDDKLADNAFFVYTTILQKLPQEKQNIRYLALKTSMGPLVKIREESKIADKKAKRSKNA